MKKILTLLATTLLLFTIFSANAELDQNTKTALDKAAYTINLKYKNTAKYEKTLNGLISALTTIGENKPELKDKAEHLALVFKIFLQEYYVDNDMPRDDILYTYKPCVNCTFDFPYSANGESIACGGKYWSKINGTKIWKSDNWVKVDPTWNSANLTLSNNNFGRNFDITNYPAFKACADLGTGWRLPTQTELNGAEIGSAGTGGAYACKSTIGLDDNWYWFSSEVSPQGIRAYIVSMSNDKMANGGIDADVKGVSYYVVCIHD